MSLAQNLSFNYNNKNLNVYIHNFSEEEALKLKYENKC